MNHFLLVGQKHETINKYLGLLRDNRDIEATHIECGQDALDRASKGEFDLAIVDEKLQDFTGLEFVEELVKVNPFMHSALVSSLTADVFHEKSEGLGVLVQLSTEPTQNEVEELIRNLNKVINLTA